MIREENNIVSEGETAMTQFADTPENGLVMRYLMALEGRNIDDVLDLFTSDAVVHSPMYGKVPAGDFYREFFKDSSKAQVTLLGLLGKGETVSGGNTTGYWARFSNLLATGALHEFDAVAIMEVKGDKIAALHIVMDTAFIRSTFDKDTGRVPVGE